MMQCEAKNPENYKAEILKHHGTCESQEELFFSM